MQKPPVRIRHSQLNFKLIYYFSLTVLRFIKLCISRAASKRLQRRVMEKQVFEGT